MSSQVKRNKLNIGEARLEKQSIYFGRNYLEIVSVQFRGGRQSRFPKNSETPIEQFDID